MAITGAQLSDQLGEDYLSHTQARNMWMSGALNDADALIISAIKSLNDQKLELLNDLKAKEPNRPDDYYEDKLDDDHPQIQKAKKAALRLKDVVETTRAFARFDNFGDGNEFDLIPQVDNNSPRRFDPDLNVGRYGNRYSTEDISLESISENINAFRKAFTKLEGIETIDRLEPDKYSRTVEQETFEPGKPPLHTYVRETLRNLGRQLTSTDHMGRKVGEPATTSLSQYLVNHYKKYEQQGTLPKGAPSSEELQSALSSIIEMSQTYPQRSAREIAQFAGNPKDLAAAGLEEPTMDAKKLEQFVEKVPTAKLPPGLVVFKAAASLMLKDIEKPNSMLMHTYYGLARSSSEVLANAVASHSPTATAASVINRYISQGAQRDGA